MSTMTEPLQAGTTRPPEPTANIRRVRFDEYKQAAACLVDAFAHDPVSKYFSWCDGFSEEKAKQLDQLIYESIVYSHLLNGLVLVAGDFDGIACWMPPGKNMDDWWTILRSGAWRLNFKLGKEGKTRYFTEFLPLLHDTKHEVLGEFDDKSWYLVYVGCRASARGKGYGSALIRYVTDMADQEGLPCYLEATGAANSGLYKKLGFDHRKTIELKRAAEPIPLGIMVREPVKPAAA
uniref:ARAD1D42020p n=1 Tax=Blastobotrys adeninivorans TaxID=409370 RepID=A0A060TDB2_BLAAD